MENIQESKEGSKLFESEDSMVDTHPQIETDISSAQVRHKEPNSKLDDTASGESPREENAGSILNEEEQHAQMLKLGRRKLEAAQLTQEVRIVSSPEMLLRRLYRNMYIVMISLHRRSG